MTGIKKSFVYIVWLLGAALLFFFECSEYTVTIFFATLSAFLFLINSEKKHDAKLQEKTISQDDIKKRKRDTTETYGIREYVPGDSIRSIHWKLSEKIEKTMVREYDFTPENEERKSEGNIQTNKRNTYNPFEKTQFGRVIDIILPIAFFVSVVMLLTDLSAVKIKMIPILICSIALFGLLFLSRRNRLIIAIGVCATAITAIAFVPVVRDGLYIFLNGLMYNSEKFNRYRYLYFETIASENKIELCSTIFIAIIAMTLAAVISLRNVISDLCIWLVTVFLMSYFGIGGTTIPCFGFGIIATVNLCYYFIKRERAEFIEEKRNVYIIKIVALLITIIVSMLSFKTFSKGICLFIDKASEQVRDILEHTEQDNIEEIIASANREEYYKVRQESTYNYQVGNEETEDSTTEYNKELLDENMISMPDYRTKTEVVKGIIMGLLGLLVIIVPFIPFYYIEKIKSKIRKQRELYVSEDARTAISAMFPQMMNYVASLLDIKDSNYERILTEAKEYKLSNELNKAYNIWLETEYSENDIEEEKRNLVKTVFDDVENELGEKTRYFKRLRYGIIK